ncbi:MAG: cupin domain-containing protein [Pseudomonadota bacterium]
MSKIIAVDPAKYGFSINRDLSVSQMEFKPGPPETVDGVSVGFVTMTESPPHGGERHPDGDEILYVISGKVKIIGDSSPAIELGRGDACIVEKGEWHRVEVLEETQLIYITPGPNSDYRPMG